MRLSILLASALTLATINLACDLPDDDAELLVAEDDENDAVQELAQDEDEDTDEEARPESFDLEADTAPASANTKWVIGEAVSQPDVMSWPGVVPIAISSAYYPAKCVLSNAYVAIKTHGDYMYVRDDCEDGRSAVGMVSWEGQDGTTIKRICRNKRGVGKWVRCNFNWSEDEIKMLTAGVYNGTTGNVSWDFSGSVFFAGR